MGRSGSRWLSGSLQTLALMMVMQMLSAMALGMSGSWWLAPRLRKVIRPGARSTNVADR
jgi:hypothetical protein